MISPLWRGGVGLNGGEKRREERMKMRNQGAYYYYLCALHSQYLIEFLQ
jgi:hypothetical protein